MSALAGILLGAFVSPILFAIVLLVPLDLWLARGYSSGRLRIPPQSYSDPTADPSYNPYARED